MSKLRNVQIYRNTSTISSYADYKTAYDAAKTAFENTTNNSKMVDGEFILYRYKLTSDTSTVHTLVGVYRVDGTNKYVEILGNYDQISSEYTSAISTAINALNASATPVTVATVSSGSGQTLTIKGVTETNGKIGDASSSTTVTIGNGALKINASAPTADGAIPTAADTNITSANATADATVKLDNTLVINADKSYGVRVKTALSGTNYVATTDDIAASSITIDGHKGAITTGNGLTDVTADGGSFAVKAKSNDYITVDANGVSLTSSKIDSAYTTANTTNIATVATVTAGINTLDVDALDLVDTTTNPSGVIGTTYGIHGVSETNGKIAKTASATDTITVGDGALKISGYGATDTTSQKITEVEATDIHSANDTADNTIALGTSFIIDTASKSITLRTNQSVTYDNNIATMKDIASLSGAMHYKGGLTTGTAGTSEGSWPTAANVTVGDTYIVTKSFTKDKVTYEVGDMVVFSTTGSNTAFSVVETNITSGVSDGQYAKNDGSLTNGQIIVATANGIKTSGYTTDAESTSGTTTITSSSTNTAIPTSKNVYDAIQKYSVQSVSDTISSSVTDKVATITNSLSVDGGTASTSSVTVKGDKAIEVVSSSTTNQIVVQHSSSKSDDTTGTAVTVDDAGETTTFVIPTLTIDDYGHVTARKNTSYTITLPASIGTAVQTVTGETNSLNNSSYVNVAATKSGTTVTLASTVQTANVSTATKAETKWYGPRCAGYDSTTTVAAGMVLYTMDHTKAEAILGTGIDWTKSVTLVDGTTATGHEMSSTDVTKWNASVGTTVVDYFAYPVTTSKGTDGLAVASDVKEYVDNHETVVEAGTNVTVSTSVNSKGGTVYKVNATGTPVQGVSGNPVSVSTSNNVTTVTLNTQAATESTVTDSYDDTSNTHKEISSITVDSYGRVTAYTTTTVTENWDCGTY